MPESQIQRAMLDRLGRIPNSWWVKTIVTNRNGCPDILGCVNGRFIAIEVKDIGKNPSKLQAFTMVDIINKGGLCVAADCWAKVEHYLRLNGVLVEAGE